MSDYIKREDAIKALEGWKISGEMILATVPSADVVEADKAQKEIDYWHDKAQSYEQTILKLSLNKADVVEVVRCKDCKYRSKEWYEDKRHKDGGYWLVCCENDAIAERVYGLAQDNDYCSFGERADT